MGATDVAIGFTSAWSPIQRGGAITLAITCIGLATLLYLEWAALHDAAERASPPSAASARSHGAEGAPRYSMPPLQNFSIVIERPLFTQSRRPSPPTANKTQGPWSSLVLAGIVISPGSREALIGHGRRPIYVYVREGQAIEGWVVSAIFPDRVVLVGSGVGHELRLNASPASQPPINGPPRGSGAR
jgi:type II secretory pathway component PulC